MTEQDLQNIENELRREHHSEARWTNTLCSVLVARLRERNARVEALELAIRRLLRHQPWPSDDRSERDFNEASRLVAEGEQ